jgi:ATP-dependent Clp protease ATP-binding subunit ClpA
LPKHSREITRLAIAEALARVSECGFDLIVSDEAFEFLFRRGMQKALGARVLKKTVQKFIADAILFPLALRFMAEDTSIDHETGSPLRTDRSLYGRMAERNYRSRA